MTYNYPSINYKQSAMAVDLRVATYGASNSEFAKTVPDSHYFHLLVSRWKQDTVLSSSATEASKHPAYKRIVAMGSFVLPLLMRELERQPDHWFIALHEITGVDPVPQADRGRIKLMTQAWLDWGRLNNYL